MSPILALTVFFICLLGATAEAAESVADLLKLIQSNESSDVD